MNPLMIVWFVVVSIVGVTSYKDIKTEVTEVNLFEHTDRPSYYRVYHVEVKP